MDEVKKPSPDHIMQFFEYGHLPANLAAISKPFCDIAHAMVDDNPAPGAWSIPSLKLPRNPERNVALRKLLEAKDAAVRAFLAKD